MRRLLLGTRQIAPQKDRHLSPKVTQQSTDRQRADLLRLAFDAMTSMLTMESPERVLHDRSSIKHGTRSWRETPTS